MAYPFGMKYDVAPLPGYQDPYGQLFAVLQDGTREWRGEMDPDLSQDAIVWQPHENAHSIGSVILHIAAVEVYWFETFALGLTPDPEEMKLLMDAETDQDKGIWPPPSTKVASVVLRPPRPNPRAHDGERQAVGGARKNNSAQRQRVLTALGLRPRRPARIVSWWSGRAPTRVVEAKIVTSAMGFTKRYPSLRPNLRSQ